MKKESEIKMNVFQRIKSIVLGYFILMMNCCFFIACESGDDSMPVTPIEPTPTETETRTELQQQAIDGIKRYLKREMELVEELEQIEDLDEFKEALAALSQKTVEIFKEETGVKHYSQDLNSKLFTIHKEENPADVEAYVDVGEVAEDIAHVTDPLQMLDLLEEWVHLSLLHPDATEDMLLEHFRESAKNGETTLNMRVISETYQDIFDE